MTPRDVVLAAIDAIFVRFDVEAAENLLAPDLIQHNPSIPTGAQAILNLIPVLRDSGIRVERHRVIAEGNLVVVHATYFNAQALGGETLVAFDVYRVENGRIAEHWDNLREMPQTSTSGHSMTDGNTGIRHLEQTADNKALVETFVDAILANYDVDRITEFVSRETYTQHNPNIADGYQNLASNLRTQISEGHPAPYSKTHLVVAEGNFVFLASEGLLRSTTPTAYFDLFRVDDGKIVEHWDVMANVPSDMVHTNGKF
ncbi:MAG: nuclear transport factor 2 family protein [Pseudomonadota bacterium]